MRYRLFAIICVPALASFSFADDGYASVTGGAVNFGHSKQIRMLSERVVIKMRDNEASVDATFHFKNLGAATTVQMGFPEEAEHGATMSGFRSEVDGNQVRVKRHWIHRPDPNAEGDFYEAIWLKRVSFQAGQDRTVRVRYVANNSVLESGTSWQEYILTTGATWAGTIGKCQLVVDYTRVHSRWGVAPRIEGHGSDSDLYPAIWKHVGKDTLAATLTAIKPNFNLRVHVLPGFWKFKINGKQVPLENALYHGAEAWPIRQGPEVLINRFAIRTLFEGYSFDAGNTIPDFAHGGFVCPSGKVVPLKRKPVTRVAGYEKKAVQFVYVSDLVKSLGGTYQFDPISGFVNLTLPKENR
jgi:hypothetical protein